MRRRSILTTLALATGALGPMRLGFGQRADAAAANTSLRVITSFSILSDLTRQVAGDAISVEALVGPDADVHIYEPRPKDLRDLMQANLLVVNGLGLEGWMDRLVVAAGFKGQTVVAATKVAPRTMQKAGQEAGGGVSVDPHAWQDPDNAILYVRAIAAGLTTVDPANAGRYGDNANRYAAQIAATQSWMQEQLAPIPADQRRIITTHDAFGYYGARFSIEFLSAEGISTELEPSAKAIVQLIAQIKREHVRAVFIENMTSPRLAKMLARETGAVLGGTVYSDALSPAGGPAATYIDLLRYNTGLFARAMRA